MKNIVHHPPEYREAKYRLLEINKKIKSIMPNFNGHISLKDVSISEVKEGYLDQESIERVIIILKSSGCAWSLEKAGGCFMCGHLCGTTKGEKIKGELYCEQFDRRLSCYDFKKYPMLCLYNSGSFLNENEIPLDARHHIFSKIAATEGIKRLIIESRPEYISEKVLEEIDRYFPNIVVEIGVGLETANEEIRDLCLNKGIHQEEYISLAQRMKKFNSKLLGYVLLKPPFITEKFAITDAINTIKFAFESGFDLVSLEPVSVQDFTIVDYLHEANYFMSPWIWSVFEVIRNTYHLGLVRIGGFEFFPVPKLFTHACNNCTIKLIKGIKNFNNKYDIAELDRITCECQKEWEYDLNIEMGNLPKRVISILNNINEDYVINMMKSKYETKGNKQDVIRRLLYNYSPNLFNYSN